MSLLFFTHTSHEIRHSADWWPTYFSKPVLIQFDIKCFKFMLIYPLLNNSVFFFFVTIFRCVWRTRLISGAALRSTSFLSLIHDVSFQIHPIFLFDSYFCVTRYLQHKTHTVAFYMFAVKSIILFFSAFPIRIRCRLLLLFARTVENK